jgi:hypothetical protein
VQGDPVNWHDPSGLLATCPWGTIPGPDGTGCEAVEAEKLAEDGGTGRGAGGDPDLGRTSAGGGSRSVVIATQGVTRDGEKQKMITLAMLTLGNIIDPDCQNWLQSGEVNDFAAFSNNLINYGLVGHGGITTSEPGATVNALTNPVDAPGFLIVINDSGAFFNAGGFTDNGRISGATLKAQVFLLLHEYAHANLVPGFKSDKDDPEAGKTNNIQIEKNCGKTLARPVLQ